MCGIAGIICYDLPADAQAERLRSMQQRLRHRGLDGAGVHFGSAAALAHTRLALLDVAGGAQPMHSPDGRFTIVHNGEIYNYPELREELRASWEFRTASDTEVVLAAYAVWGEACLPRFNGMFAFFIWDEQTGEGFAARDRLGIKPFVYRGGGGELLFASEAKALLAASRERPRVHVDGVLEYLTAPYFSGVAHSMFEDIEHLPAGHALRITRPGLRVWRWWDDTLPSVLREDAETLAGEMRRLLHNAVSRTLRADVPVGVFLSGGLDSTLLAALARKFSPEPPLCFAIRFAGQDRFDYGRSTIVTGDDSPYVETAVKELGLQLEWVDVDRNHLLDDLEQVACIDDALPAWEQELSQYHLARAASRRRKAVLVGDAADETHYGYHFLLDEEATRSPAGFLRRFGIPPLRRELLADPEEHFAARYTRLAQQAGYSWDSPDGGRLATTYLIIKRWLARLLHNGDIHGMAWSLEARVPFGDIDLLDLARQVSPRVGFRDGTEKALLRQAAVGLIPETIRRRKKSALPKDQDVQALYQHAAGRMLDEAEDFLGFFLDLEAVRELCRPERPLTEWERALLFRVLALGCWARHYGVLLP